MSTRSKKRFQERKLTDEVSFVDSWVLHVCRVVYEDLVCNHVRAALAERICDVLANFDMMMECFATARDLILKNDQVVFIFDTKSFW